MKSNLTKPFVQLTDNIYNIFGIDRLAARCANQSPIYWSVEENIEKEICCWLVRFYNQHNEVIHTEHIKEWNNQLLDEKTLKQLDKIRHTLIKKNC